MKTITVTDDQFETLSQIVQNEVNFVTSEENDDVLAHDDEDGTAAEWKAAVLEASDALFA